ncbi:MAG: AraC family transcriptional regulator ligand-binding domain-containing protein [Pseudomonadota bacterium]
MNRTLTDRLLLPTIPAAFLGDVLHAADFRGLDVDGLLEANDLSRARLSLPGLRVSVDRYSQVLRQLGQVTDDAFFGFLSRPVPLNALEVCCYGMVGCRNLDELIGHVNDFYGLFSDDFYWTLERHAGNVLITAHVHPVLPVDYRFVIQSLLLMSIRLFGWLLGEDAAIKGVRFSFAKNATDDSLSYLFGNRIDFGCEANTVRLDGAYAKATLSCTRDQIALLLKSKRHLFLLNRHKNSLAEQVRCLLLLGKNQTWLDAVAVSKQLKLTPNQLWRKLKREGTSFLEIRDAVKRDWALALLEDPANTVEMVSDRLRYCDVSAFRKAFRKWTGMQPVRYRRTLG